MTESRTVRHRGRTLEIVEDRRRPSLRVDGRARPVQHLGQLGRHYWSPEMAFSDFESIEDLGRALVERDEARR